MNPMFVTVQVLAVLLLAFVAVSILIQLPGAFKLLAIAGLIGFVWVAARKQRSKAKA